MELAQARWIDGKTRLLVYFAYHGVLHRFVDLDVAAYNRQPGAIVPIHHQKGLDRTVARGALSPLDDNVN